MKRISFLIFIILLCAIREGPTTYKDLGCVEPEHGYVHRLIQYFTATKIEKLCPTHMDLVCRIGYEVFSIIICMLITLLLVSVPSIGIALKNRLSRMVSMAQEWKNRVFRCRYCGTNPCQVKRRSTWLKLRPPSNNNDNYSERSNAMMLYNCGLEVSTLLTKELPQDDTYWERRFCQTFEEKHMRLFPLCIQRQIDNSYPVPR
ncbi:uncharacterized protein LOC132548148 [Ylistrum balloti]|uniref:uncharacterized protein LOC132548148 n=1 Tax=Ylistrum balloti TaxID=509963 RepID=UPI0029058810|nr:uncharacterized protein LOC132548148 [Ylistrum balloti]